MPALDDFGYWRKYAPRVELRGEDNLHVAYQALTTPWPAGASPPIVRVRITPQQKDWPSFAGPLGNLGGVLSPILSLVPAVGPLLSIGVGTAATLTEAAAQGAAVKGLQKTPTSAFEPSLAPRPFYVFLPLDAAQLAVREPWRVPALVAQFDETLSLLQSQRRSADTLTAAGQAGAVPAASALAVATRQPRDLLLPVAVILIAAVVLIVQRR
jgi:hypothetical protein